MENEVLNKWVFTKDVMQKQTFLMFRKRWSWITAGFEFTQKTKNLMDSESLSINVSLQYCEKFFFFWHLCACICAGGAFFFSTVLVLGWRVKKGLHWRENCCSFVDI